MATFEYTRANITLEAYGKEYPIPTKTADFINSVNDIQTQLAACKTATETVEITRKGIALFIGDDETERIFPADRIGDIDTDEIAAFWWALNAESNRATQAVIEKYAPNPTIRKVK